MGENESETEVKLSTALEAWVRYKAGYFNKPAWNMLFPNSTHPSGQAFLLVCDGILVLKPIIPI